MSGFFSSSVYNLFALSISLLASNSKLHKPEIAKELKNKKISHADHDYLKQYTDPLEKYLSVFQYKFCA